MNGFRVGLACFLVAGSANADLKLVPQSATYELDGVRFSQVAFQDGDKRVTYSPPSGWECSGGDTKLTLRPKDKPQAEGTIARIPLSEPAAFNESTEKALIDEALASVPPGSTNVQLLSKQDSPVSIGGRDTFLITMSYTFYGENYGRSLMFMNRDAEQFRFQLICRLIDFKELQQAFFQSHFSWQNL